MLVHPGITNDIIGAAIEVHRHFGPGLLESAYVACLEQELRLRRIPFEREVPIPVVYKGIEVDRAYRADFIVRREVVVEVKAVEGVLRLHESQLLTYLKISGCPVGLLVNFNVPILKQGIRRFIRRSASTPFPLDDPSAHAVAMGTAIEQPPA